MYNGENSFRESVSVDLGRLIPSLQLEFGAKCCVFGRKINNAICFDYAERAVELFGKEEGIRKEVPRL